MTGSKSPARPKPLLDILAGNVPLIIASILAVILFISLLPKGSPPRLAVNRTSFDFSGAQFGEPCSDTFTITNSGGQVLTGTISANTKWLGVTPDKISIPKGSQEYMITADTKMLKPGFAGKGSITITSNAGTKTLDVLLSIKEAPPSDLPGPVSEPGSMRTSATGKIAFKSDRKGNEEIFVMNADGSGQANISNNPAYDGEPAWSPDNARIAFCTDRDGNQEIYVMNADGSNQTNLSNNGADDAYPEWSPDGTKIAFRSDRDGNYEIYAMDASGGHQTNLSRNNARDNYPTWSPDGRYIAFMTDRDGKQEIYVMDANGGNQVNVSRYAGADDAEPAWSSAGGVVP